MDSLFENKKEYRDEFAVKFISEDADFKNSIVDEMATVLVAEDAISKVYEKQAKIGDYELEEGEVLKTPEAFLKVLKEIGDDKPMIMEMAVPSGYSRKITPSDDPSTEPKNRFWKPDVIRNSLVAKVNALGEQGTGLPGYRGHPRDELDLKTLPNPAVLWVAAANARNINTGEHAGILRGYVYAVDNNRQYIKTGAFSTGSVMAAAEIVPEMHDEQPVMVVEKANFFSVDLVRKGTEGIRNTKVIHAEGADMEFTAEELKLLAKLTAQNIKDHCPKAAVELSGEAGKLASETSQLVDRLQTLTMEKAELAVGNAIAKKMAEMLSCEISELPLLVQQFTDMRKVAIDLAIEQAVKDIKPESLQKAVKKRLIDKQFTKADEVKTAAESAINETKQLLADLGLEMGAVDTNETFSSKSFSVASPTMQEKLKNSR